MSTLAIEKDPKNWDEFKFHSASRTQAIKWISTNKFPNMIFVSGPSGSGKTAYAKLLRSSIHCLNRKAGEYQPCGECAICKSDPRDDIPQNNIVWIQAGQEEKLSAQINLALAEANLPIYGIHPEHRDWKIIVVDEAQRLDKRQMQDLLFLPDLGQRMGRNKVLFIVVTMDEESLNSTVRDALRSRSSHQKFRGLSETETLQFLRTHYTNAPLESLRLISGQAKGNLRWAHNLVADCKDLDPELSEIAVAEKLCIATTEERKKLWVILENLRLETPEYFKIYQKYISELESRCDPYDLGALLLEDIEESINSMPTADQWSAELVLSEYLSKSTPLKLNQVLRLLGAKKLVDINSL
jgi:DNA polymerase III delta prime subunit